MKRPALPYFLIILIMLCRHGAYAQSRIFIPFNTNWEFTKDSFVRPGKAIDQLVKWQTVTLPHSWNTTDVMDDQPGYYRAACWYRKTLMIDAADKGKEIYLQFEGANQFTEVYINGVKAGDHTGGYTAFQFSIAPLLHFNSNNEILVKVDNRYDPQVPPLTADFTFFGGLYRDVWLVKTNAIHFDMDDYCSSGVFVSTPNVDSVSATVHIRSEIVNSTSAPRKINVISKIIDKAGKEIRRVNESITIEAGKKYVFNNYIAAFKKPHLWSPNDPYLYNIKTSISDAISGVQLDEVTNQLGFRWFYFDAGKGFSLNGKPYKLIGTSRHQDRPNIGNAVPDKLARRDVELLKEMGGNFLRVAHYPQDPSIMKACDELGILASVEIPIVNEITESDTFYRHCDTMLIEMIRQNFNHTSVIVWCYMNEVMLRPHFNDDKARQKIYFSNIVQLAKRLDSITRAEDASRYTMIANHGDFDRYRTAGLTDVPMIVGWNLYSGWYGGELNAFPAFLDKHHQLLPNKPMIVSEYGADADPRITSLHPVRFDKSVDYATRFHQYYFQEIMKRSFVSAGVVWNLADFNSETREETMPHINNKGLLQWDRTPKDPYYFYKAILSTKPFVKILASQSKRAGIADIAQRVCYQPVLVATNLDSVELFFNRKSQGWRKPEQGMCQWNVGFLNNINNIKARGVRSGKSYTDQTAIQFLLQPYYLNDTICRFTEMNILLGADRYFTDSAGIIWQPNQTYRVGSWGNIGGIPFKLAGNTRLPYGTDKNIVRTYNDPIYQTQLTGITEYRIDVPDGHYDMTLYFAELQGTMAQNLAYNLADSVTKQKVPRRRFDVLVNGVAVVENLDLAAQYGIGVPVRFTVTLRAVNGIRITFKNIEGEAVLNALSLSVDKEVH